MTAPTAFAATFGSEKPIIGVLHLRGADDDERLAVARTEIEQLTAEGVDALLVEDYFGPVGVVELVLAHLAEARPEALYGVNVLRDYELSFALAERYGARFVQLDSVAGHLPPSEDARFAEHLGRLRAASGACVLGGVRFKYQPYLSGLTLEEDLALAAGRCDGVVVTGSGTGEETDPAKIAEFRRLLGSGFPLLVGAGVTDDNLAGQLAETDGAIVGSFFKHAHVADERMEPANIRRFMLRVRELREAAHVR